MNVEVVEIREVLALHTARLSKIEARLTELGNWMTELAGNTRGSYRPWTRSSRKS